MELLHHLFNVIFYSRLKNKGALCSYQKQLESYTFAFMYKSFFSDFDKILKNVSDFMSDSPGVDILHTVLSRS